MRMPRPKFLQKLYLLIALGLLAFSQGAGAVPYTSGVLDFATEEQSMWGSGGATILQDSQFFGTSWSNVNKSFGPGFIGGVSTVAVPTNPAWYAWQLCPFLCGDEPSKDSAITTVDTRSGADVTLNSSGKFGLEMGYLVDAGSLNATVQFNATAQIPTGPLAPGQAIKIVTGSSLTDGSLNTQSPTAKAYINAIAELSATITAEGCFIGACASGSGNLVAFAEKLPLVEVSAVNGIEILPELLPPQLPSTERNPLFKSPTIPDLTLSGKVSIPPVPPSFEVASAIGCLASTSGCLPVPGVGISLASLSLKIPEITASGGVVGNKIMASGTDDFAKVKVDLDGVATMSGLLPPLGLEANLINAAGLVVKGSLDVLDIDAGPDLGLIQDFELTPTLMARLSFSQPVLIAGNWVTQRLADWNNLPEMAFLGGLTEITPTFMIDAQLKHLLSMDISLSGTFDLFRLAYTIAFQGTTLGGGSLSLNQLLGFTNVLFDTGTLAKMGIYDAPAFVLDGFSSIVGPSFVISVPEPAILFLFALGLVGLVVTRRSSHCKSA